MPDLPVALRRYLDVSRQPAGSAFHTSQVSISFGEPVDAAALKGAWELVQAAHPALRAAFGADGSVTESPKPIFDWQELDWKTSPPADLGAEWQSLVDSDAATPIAVESASPCRITLLALPNGGGHALWSFHAAFIDESSISGVLHQWLHAYDNLRTGAEAPQFQGSAVSAPIESAGWQAAFEGFQQPRPLIVLPLPDTESDGTRRSISHTFERPERSEFAAAAAAMKADLRSLFGAAWAFVIARAASSDDTLLLEPSLSAGGIGRGETFLVRRRRVDEFVTSGELVRAFAAEIPAPPIDPAAIAQALGLPVAAIEPATVFVYRELTLNDRLQLEMPRWMAADAQLFQKTPGPITLHVVATDRPQVALDYDPGRLSDSAARLLFDLFLGTLAAFAADPALQLGDFALPGKPAVFEGPEAPATFRSLVPQSLHELFADVAAESPDAVAVEMAGEKITFSQLNASANQIARHLRKRGVEAGSRVGISMPRSTRWVAAILGALKAGASIVPINESATTAIAGIRSWIVDALPEGATRELPVVQMQAEAGAIGGEKTRGVQNEATPASEAIAWAGGSEVHSFTHEAVAIALQSRTAELGLTPADRVLQFAPTGSFTAIEETLSTLLSGATLVLRSDPRWATRTAVQEFVQENAVTTLGVPAPFWSQWTHYLAELSLQAPPSLRLVTITGSFPPPNAVAAWLAAAGETRLLQRTTAAAACGLGLSGEPTAENPSLLGQAGPATSARIVDKRGLPIPAGLAGWADVAPREGTFVPLGIEAFASNDGNFHARACLQAAIAGASPDVLADSIRLAAATHPEVLDAYVDQRLIAARNEWCLWIVPRDSQRGEPHDFREWLAGRLPAVPRRIRALPRLPLDEAGSIDIAALAELLPDDGSALPASKGTDAEESLRKIVSRILGGRRIELDEILTDGRTKPQVAKLLHEAIAREEPRVELADLSTGFSIRSLLRNVRSRKSGQDSKWTPLQPLRASGKLPPLVFIHDLDGAAKLYASLVAHIAGDQPCYAITARGLSDPSACHTTVQEMARAYIEALRVFDANGPYRLVGYGFGGLVAFEMARQLHEASADIALLILLATEPPAASSAMGFLAGGWKRSLPALFGKKSAEESNGRRRTSETPAARANQEAARKYSAGTTSLMAHVFAPTQDFPSYRAVQGGWEACCEQVLLYQVPCSGADMMAEPAVESLAEAISRLARAGELDGELEE